MEKYLALFAAILFTALMCLPLAVNAEAIVVLEYRNATGGPLLSLSIAMPLVGHVKQMILTPIPSGWIQVMAQNIKYAPMKR